MQLHHPRIDPDPGYETVTENQREKMSLPVMHMQQNSNPITPNVNVVHMSVRKTVSEPMQSIAPVLMRPRNSASVVVIEHTKMAVNNNIGENPDSSGGSAHATVVSGQDQDQEQTTANSKQIQSHIFV